MNRNLNDKIIEILPKETPLEFRLMIEAVKISNHNESPDVFNHLCSTKINWDVFYHMNLYHGVSIFTSRALTKQKLHIPIRVSQRFLNSKRRNIIQTLHLTRELFSLLKLFEQENIKVVPFKGPFLSFLLYNDFSVRPPGDLDIFVPENSFYSAEKILFDNGYRYGDIQISKNQQEQFNHINPHIVYTHPEKNITVEIHWGLTSSPGFSSRNILDIRNSIETKNILQMPVSCIHPHMLLVYLCIHAASHSWSRLIWLTDIAKLARTMTIEDISSVFELSKKIDRQNPIIHGLLLSHLLVSLRLPNEIIQQIDRKKHFTSVRKAFNVITIHHNLNLSYYIFSLLRRRESLYKLTAFNSISYRFSIIAKPFMPSLLDIKIVHLSGIFKLFYLFLRPIFWILRYIKN